MTDDQLTDKDKDKDNQRTMSSKLREIADPVLEVHIDPHAQEVGNSLGLAAKALAPAPEVLTSEVKGGLPELHRADRAGSFIICYKKENT